MDKRQKQLRNKVKVLTKKNPQITLEDLATRLKISTSHAQQLLSSPKKKEV